MGISKVKIIGGGLAGTLLSARCCTKGLEVELIDDADPMSSSNIAAGLFNVYTGKLAAKTWMADELLSSLNEFFLEDPFKKLKRHLTIKPIYRPFHNSYELNDWASKFPLEESEDKVVISPEPIMNPELWNPHGGLWINNCGWLNVKPFLKELKKILEKEFGMKKVVKTATMESLTNRSKEKETAFIFCEGVKGRENPIFSVPVIPLKGQILKIKIPEFNPEFILSNKVFFIPVGNHEFICGSTYERSYDTEKPTQKGLEELSQYIREAINFPFEVLEHYSGIRPTTRNFRPIMGRIEDTKPVYIYNGLGTKGVIQSFFLSEMLANYILGETDYIPKEVDVRRFFV